MKISIILLLVSAQLFAIGQKTEDPVTYELIRNNPNFTYVGGGLAADFNFWQPNFTMLALGPTGMFVHERFSADVNGRFHLLDRWKDRELDESSVYTQAVTHPNSTWDLQLGGSYYIYNSTTEEEKPLTLDRLGNIVYMTKIPMKTSLRLGADLYFRTGKTYYNFRGQDVSALDSAGNDYDIQAGWNQETVSSYLKQSSVRAGLSMTWMNDILIKTEKYGEKGGRWMTKVHLHAIFGFAHSIEDVVVPGNVFFGVNGGTYDISTNMTYKSIGGAFGYEGMYFLPNFTYSYVLEFGLLPAPSTQWFANQVFATAKVRLMFGAEL